MTPQDHINSDGLPSDPWRISSVQQVEEVKCLLRIMPIWLAAVVYQVAIVPQQTYVVFQALQSDRRLGSTNFEIPAASYTVFTTLSLTIWIPIYGRILVPLLQRLSRKEAGITVLQRKGTGIVFSTFTSLVSALVEKRRRAIALTKPTIGISPRRGAISSMSASWLIPQLVIIGVSEAFTMTGQVEFYYKQFPKNMRSIAGSLYFCALAGSSYLSTFFITTVHRTTKESASGNWLPDNLNKGRLDYFYYMIAALQALDLVYFLVCANWYSYKGSRENTVDVRISLEKPAV